MKRAIYIVSMEHSGSTILSLVLSSHPNILSFGEVDKVINASSSDLPSLKDRICLCGNKVSQCSFWGPLISEGHFADAMTDTDAYFQLSRHFYKLYGDDHIFLDSSKILKNMISLNKVDNIDSLKVVFLIKDVRSYVYSILTKATHRVDSLKNVPHILRSINHWYRQNKAMLTCLDERKIDYIKIGYEELCLYPDMIIAKLCNFLNTDYYSEMKFMTFDDSHQIFGNRMRKQKSKNKTIMYDNRWFRDIKTSQLLSFMPNVWKFNLQNTYSNTKTSIWDT